MECIKQHFHTTPNWTKNKVDKPKALPKEILDALAEPLPKEAVGQHPTKSYLSTIKAIYVVERLNKVFGINGWHQRNEVISSSGQMKVVHSFLEVPEYGITLENFGGNDNPDEGDAWKGAATDALTKMASYLGIGMDVFKGLATESHQTRQDQPGREIGHKKPQYASKPATDKQKAFITKLVKERNLPLPDNAWFEALTLTDAKTEIDKLLVTPIQYETAQNSVQDTELDMNADLEEANRHLDAIASEDDDSGDSRMSHDNLPPGVSDFDTE